MNTISKRSFAVAETMRFINWINNTLEIKRTANVLWNLSEPFDFQICGTVEGMDQLIRETAASGFTARMTVGILLTLVDPEPRRRVSQ